jgi:hypothetical protein
MNEEKLVKCECNTDVVYVEYGYDDPYRYDGISEYKCLGCMRRWGRWTGKELKGEEQEPPYGDPKYITKENRHYNL